ncbi:zinc-dependent metalloprotease [Chitinophaga pendula]|uniref:M57 family metalloprotease n=1 Tax=Chitinophaga TaxID=79328 RepID=UPI0018DFBF15|nr:MULTISPECIES: M57 family metalloprotease [Chitinophaga]UCJ08353.1 zinc-dependent metalloprotease [Chitinophaga pendula]
MKKQAITVVSCLVAGTLMLSCQKENKQQDASATTNAQVSADVKSQISARGFNAADARKVNGGYLVEGDILLSEDDLSKDAGTPNLRIADVEQYRTNYLVKNLPRTITVKVVNLGNAFIAGADTAIARYNRLNLSLKFSRITSGTANITIQGFNEGPDAQGFITLGSAGFPTSSGNPYNTIQMNTNQYAYGSNPNVLYVGSVIQHEMGHCIGFRHTDYMNRAFSCGSAGAGNEGASSIGAVAIPGTPTTPDAASWMLACSNGGNRTFNANDVKALDYLY